MSVRFGPTVRLRASADFSIVQRQGRRVAARYLTLLGRPNALGRDRLGVIASRKVGGAVVRNRAKRRMRDLFRRQEPDTIAGAGLTPFDLVVIVRRELVTAPAADLATDFVSALRRMRGTSEARMPSHSDAPHRARRS